jgi:TrmH family RNA methyltransferase
MLKNLKTKKGRDEAGLFLVEGEKFIAEIPAEYKILRYVFSQKFAEAHDISSYEKRARCEIIRDSLFASLADTVTPQGVMAVCEKILYKPSDILQRGGFFLLGENIADPGNVGALVRTAAAAGASGAIFTRGSCDVFSPKAIRAAAGAILRLPVIADVDAEEIFLALKNPQIKANSMRNGLGGFAATDETDFELIRYKIFAAHPRGDALPYDLDFRENFCILIGNEAHGISENARAHADALVRLPMTRETESLNASIAGSILLYEAVRQRMNCTN